MSSKLPINKHIKKSQSYSNQYLNIHYRNLFEKDTYNPIEVRFVEKSNKNLLHKSKINGVCLVSGRSRSVTNNLKMGRMVFKKYASEGLLAGIKKK